MQEKMYEFELRFNSLKFKASRSANQILQRFRDNSRIAILRYEHPISNAQTFPITKTLPGTIQFQDLSLFSEHIQNSKSQYQIIFIQSIWHSPAETLIPILDKIHHHQRNAKVVFLDWYAPIHIPQPKILEMVDLYVKKQVLKNRQKYTGMHDTNLIEYEYQYNDNYTCDLETIPYLQVDLDVLDEKLFIGWNFATDRRLTEQLSKGFYLNKDRPIDIHCRIFAPSERKSWYQHMRGRAYDAVQTLSQKRTSQIKVLNENIRVKYYQYINELVHSKLCLSPFGYGEVCWRDFEAILAGALLIKPSMDHIETYPNVYIPYETYVPCQWDFSDLDEQCMRYIQDEHERQRIVLNAVQVWQSFLKHEWPELWSKMVDRLSLSETAIQALSF